jgi:hypothetical protein
MQASARRVHESRTQFRILCFDEFPERLFELAGNLQTEKLSGDLQNASTLFVAGFQFREEFHLLQLNCDIVVGAQDRTYSFRNARSREDAAQRLQRFVHWEVSFEETFHRRFAVLALNVHGLRHRSKPHRFSLGW